MHRSLDNTLRSLRQDLDLHLDPAAIEQACRQIGHRWRICRLIPPVLVHWFLIQILHGNTALNHLTLLAQRHFTASAYCQARARLPLAVLQAVLRSLVTRLAADPNVSDEGLWNGHRTLLIDGSSFSMPDNAELQEHFGQPGGQKPSCGFPVAKILAGFQAKTGLLLAVDAAPLRTHEMTRLDAVHPAIEPGDVVVGDRGLVSYAHLALLSMREAHGVFRLHQRQEVDFTPGRPHQAGPGGRGDAQSRWIRSPGTNDQVVELFRPQSRPKWMTAERFAALPESMLVRELRYSVSWKGRRTRQITRVTTLLDAERYSAASLAELYAMRWRVEQNRRDLKQTMGMDVLKCRAGAPNSLQILGELAAYSSHQVRR